MKSILFTNHYTGAPLAIVREEIPDGFDIRFLPEQTPTALMEAAPEAEYILAGGRLQITKDVLDRAARLRMIQRSGVGLDALDLDAIRARGIPLYVNRGVNAQSVAEHALLLMLACLRRLTLIDRNFRQGVWKKQEQGVRTAELKGKTVGIVGMGSIARALLPLLKPFGVRILYHDVYRAEPAFEEANGLAFAELPELLRDADIVTVHCPLTDATRHLFDARTLSQMKPGSILVNTARGPVVDAAALADALRDGPLAFAALDVHEEEPAPADYPLKALDNVILTPHIGGVTRDSFRAMMREAFRNIACFDRGDLETIAPYRYL